MRKMYLPPAFLLSMMLFSANAHADFIVQFGAVNGSFTTQFTVPTSGFPVDITITNANVGFWRIYSDNPAIDILKKVIFNGDVSNRDIKLILGRPGINYNPFVDPGAGACFDWTDGVQESGALVTVQASVLNDLGHLDVTRIARLKAGNNIWGRMKSHSSEDIIQIEADHFKQKPGVAGPRLDLLGGDVQLVLSQGDLFMPIIAQNAASIGTMRSVTGSIVTTINTVTGNVGFLDAAQHIGGIVVTQGGDIIELRAGGSIGQNSIV